MARKPTTKSRIWSMVRRTTSLPRFRSRTSRVHKLSAACSPYARLTITRALLLIPSTGPLVCRVSK